MNVLWLSHLIPYPPKGGVLQRSYNLVKELSKYHQVDLLAFNQHRLLRPLFQSLEAGVEEANRVLQSYCGKKAFFNIPNERNSWGRFWLPLKSLWYEPYTINWLKSKEFADQLERWLKAEKYDLVHFDTLSLLPFFPLVPSGMATCLDHHNIESHMLLRRARKERNLLKKAYFWQEGKRLLNYERRFCPQFSLNITCSDIDTNRLLEIAPLARVQTIPNGVDLDYFLPKGDIGIEERIIFVGTMNWYPNIEAVHYIAAKLWPQLKRKYPKLECDIVGADPPESIRALTQISGFNVHGFVDDVRPFMERAAVYVCPIQDGGGTKLKILDAMAMSKAIVAHPMACEGIMISEGRNILLADTASGFVQHIDSLFASSVQRESIGREARQLVEKFYGYRAIGNQLSTVLQACVA